MQLKCKYNRSVKHSHGVLCSAALHLRLNPIWWPGARYVLGSTLQTSTDLSSTCSHIAFNHARPEMTLKKQTGKTGGPGRRRRQHKGTRHRVGGARRLSHRRSQAAPLQVNHHARFVVAPQTRGQRRVRRQCPPREPELRISWLQRLPTLQPGPESLN